MNQPHLLVLGTRNRNKVTELADLLGPHGLELRTLADFSQAIDVVEDGQTFADNAAKKAVQQSQVLRHWVLGEDSGLVVDVLDGAPGVFSARFSGAGATDQANNSFLLERFPARQPSFFQLDLRVSKEFRFGDKGGLELIAEVFNLTNASNLYSNPLISAIVAPELDRIPQPGDIGPTGTAYRTLDQVAPGSTSRAIQLGARLRF